MEYEDRVRISTPEGVDVELTLAGIGSRFIAALLDFLIQSAVLLAAALLLGVTGSDRDGVAVAIFTIIFFLVFFGYDVLFEVRSRGRTPGKRWTGLRVVRTGGQPITFVPSCVRNVMRLVDMLPAPPLYAVGMTSIFFTRQNQRLGDLAAGTMIVRERPGGLHAAETAPSFSRPVSDGWDVSAVSAQDIGTVRQFLARRPTLASGPRDELADELAKRLRPLVAGAPEQLEPEEFLERLSAAKR
jgi:uncharacterized RDD family membrane protein YckC